jgi:two-component system sensor histidine kinase/response regulator
MDAQSKLLIIDDEEVVLDSCIQILRRENYEILTADNGQRGLEMIEEFQPDLTFVDLKMPGISGFEVLERIAEIDPTMVTIVITGFATITSAVDAMQRGAFDFLPKPFTPDELRLITRRGLEKRKLVLETLALRREKEMLREHFAAIVSHELKSPLAAVQQYLIALSGELSHQLNEDQKRRFDRIQTRLDDLMKLIHTWLRAISVDVQSIKDNFVPTAIPGVIFKAVESVEPNAARKDIRIHTSIANNLPLVYGDEGTLTEAAVNIIGNAVKYSATGSRVFVSASLVEDEIWLTFRDNGIGIPDDDLPFIFEDFYRTSSDRKVERGSGVGLALTRRIVEAHGGTISVESKLGEGSTFVIKLPVKQESKINQNLPEIDLVTNH